MHATRTGCVVFRALVITSGDENHLCGASLRESQNLFESIRAGVVCQAVARVIAQLGPKKLP